jgi:predicted transcriptional regulator
MSKDDAQPSGDVETGPVEAARGRLDDRAERAVQELDERSVELLSWLLDTETRARIYVYLRETPWSTSDEIADGTGLYPSTVREALADLTDDEILERRKRESEGAGNNPFEYEAIAPSELVADLVGQLQAELNALCRLGGEDQSDGLVTDPVHIEVQQSENPKS